MRCPYLRDMDIPIIPDLIHGLTNLSVATETGTGAVFLTTSNHPISHCARHLQKQGHLLGWEVSQTRGCLFRSLWAHVPLAFLWQVLLDTIQTVAADPGATST